MKVQELGHAVLYVRDLEASAHFYGEVLGLPSLGDAWPGARAFSGGRTHHELLLIEVGPDGEALTEDDVVRGCRGPHLGWPQEFWAGWPVNESVMRTGEVR